MMIAKQLDEYVQCQICGNWYSAIIGHLKKHNLKLNEYKQLYSNAKIYSDKAYEKMIQGAIEGAEKITQISKELYPKIYYHKGSLNPKIIERIKRRDKNSCIFQKTQFCHEKLEIHHIIRRTFFYEKNIADDEDNLITLCINHHRYFERNQNKISELFDMLKVSLAKREFLMSQVTIPKQNRKKITLF